MNEAQHIFMFIGGIIIVLVVGIILINLQEIAFENLNPAEELSDYELRKASCKELEVSIKKCTTSGFRDSAERETCKIKHILKMDKVC